MTSVPDCLAGPVSPFCPGVSTDAGFAVPAWECFSVATAFGLASMPCVPFAAVLSTTPDTGLDAVAPGSVAIFADATLSSG